jgi:hypothetical protein
LKKQAGSVRFRFYKKKTEPNRNRKNQKKTEPNRKNRAKPVFAQKTELNLTKTGWFDPISVRFWFF